MKNLYLSTFLLLFSFFNFIGSYAQTSWTGVTSVNWASPTNWTNGVPSATMDVVIGDASFTGSFQPAISASSNAKTLTIGSEVLSQLTVASTFTVKGDINIHSKGKIINGNASISLTGDWINEALYTSTSNNATVIFAGINQFIRGSEHTLFRKLTINSGSIVSLQSDFTCSGASSVLIVSGTLNPGEPTTHLVTADSLIVNSSAVLKVNASDFNSNYQVLKPIVLNAGSIVEYSSKIADQEVSNDYTYSTLRISGAGTVKNPGGQFTATAVDFYYGREYLCIVRHDGFRKLHRQPGNLGGRRRV